MFLSDLTDAYLSDHDEELSRHWALQLRDTVSTLGQHLGRPPLVSDLTPDGINTYLLWLSANGRAAATRKTRRSALLALWRHGYDCRLTDEPPRCKRVRLPQCTPDAWTQDEVRQLVQAAGAMRGRFRLTRIERAPYMQSLFLCLYGTGLRIGDALDLPRRAIHPDGRFTLIQGKTRRQITRHLYPQALELLDSTGAQDRELCWPLWARREQLFTLVRGIVKDTLPPHRRGTTKWFRRSAATHHAQQHGEAEAARLLDHRDVSTTRGHYLDAGQLPSPVVMGPDCPL